MLSIHFLPFQIETPMNSYGTPRMQGIMFKNLKSCMLLTHRIQERNQSLLYKKKVLYRYIFYFYVDVLYMYRSIRPSNFVSPSDHAHSILLMLLKVHFAKVRGHVPKYKGFPRCQKIIFPCFNPGSRSVFQNLGSRCIYTQR